MKTISDIESKILRMKIISKDNNEEKNKQVRFEKLNIYQQFKRYQKMINVYNRQKKVGNIKNLLKVNDPTKNLGNFLKIEGLDPAKDISEYRNFKNIVDKIMLDNPEMDLTDITDMNIRGVVSDIINQTQEGKELCPADLDFVAIAEGYGLYKAIVDIKNGKDRDLAIKDNGITEEMLQKGEQRIETRDNKVKKGLYERAYKDVDEVVYIASSSLGIGITEAKVDLESFEVIHSQEREITTYDLLVEKEEPQEYKMMAFEKALKMYEGNEEWTNKTKNLIDEYLNKIDEHNKKREELEIAYRREHNGNPSPVFLRELREYQIRKSKEVKQENKEMQADDREIG